MESKVAELESRVADLEAFVTEFRAKEEREKAGWHRYFEAMRASWFGEKDKADSPT